MELILKGRGIRITEHVRKTAEHKLAKIERLDPRVRRFEAEIIGLNPRIGGSHRVEVSCEHGRQVFRAAGTGHDVDSAFDQVIEHLERQISSYRGKLRDRLTGRRHKLQSAGTSTEESGI